MTPLERITQRVAQVGDANDPSTPFSLLTLVEFFEGNDVEGSIGCNLDSTPKPKQFYKLFERIESQPNVDRVLIQITAFDDPDWPFSDTAWVVATASEDEVRSWFPEELMPNEIWTGWIESQKYENVDIPDSHSVLACWWD